MSEPRPEGRYPLNTPGPFYVQHACCIGCGAPEAEAPELMAFDETETSCYFRRQPTTPDETYHAIRAVWASCICAVRYSGRDPDVLRRLAELGEASACDHPPAPLPEPLVRTHVTFQYQVDARHPGQENHGQEIAAGMIAGLVARHAGAKATQPRYQGTAWTFRVTIWEWARPIEVRGQPVQDAEQTWLLQFKVLAGDLLPAYAFGIDDSLRADPHYTMIRWYTEHDWTDTPEQGSPTPF